MAEVLGTVVGVVSLGLQVCSGLSVYIDGLQCRREEIESTIRHHKSLETLIAQIEGLHSRRQALGICSAPLQESMASAKAELLLLDEFISKNGIEEGTGTERLAGNMMKIQKKRLLYPFRRDRLDRLVTRLDVVIKALQTALQVFELETSLEMKNSFEQVIQTVSRSELNMLAIERKIDENASAAQLQDYTTKKEVIELKKLIADLMSSSAAGTLKNMVSKPSALRVICDNMNSLETIGRTDDSYLDSSETVKTEFVRQETNVWSQFHCNCKPQRILRRQKRSFGGVSFAKEAVTKRAHVIGCPFAVLSTQETNSWSAGITFRAFQGLISTAVNVSLSITTGAGGFGVSPTFTCCQMRQNSPAFQVVDILLLAYRTLQHKSTGEELNKLFERSVQTLKTVFTSRASSPFEIDTKGDTLLHAASRPYPGIWIDRRHELIDFLLTVGVPRDRPNQHNKYAFHLAQIECMWHIHDQNSLRAARTLDTFTFPELLGLPSFANVHQLQMMRFHETWIRNSITAAQGQEPPSEIIIELMLGDFKVYGYYSHPLEAVLLRNKSRLLEASDKQISLSLSEADVFGLQFLYHLIGWPEGLNIVLSRCGKLILQSHDKDTVTISALECALQWSGAICSGPSDRCLETCSCAETVSVLLQTDSECLARTTLRESWLYAMNEASPKAQDMVVNELANRRQELKDLALRHLKPTDIDSFGLLENSILDKHTGNVLKALVEKGICVHPSLYTELVGEKSSASASIYHCKWMRYDASDRMRNAFYSRGFTEVDVPNAHGFVPLAIVDSHARYKKWLVEHGASLTTEVPGKPVGFTTAHILFCPSKYFSSSLQCIASAPGLFKSFRSHVSRVSSCSFLDACKCGCSKDGCHPHVVMWRAAWAEWSVEPVTQASLKEAGSKIIGLCEYFETDWAFSRDERSICLRVCTFAALPVRHTCCSSWEHVKGFDDLSLFTWRCWVYNEERIEEIREEDADELALLESLLLEFESKIDEMGCTLAVFFETYWMNRMGQVLREIKDRPLLEEEVQGAERLGISLRVEEEDKQEDRDQLGYWFRRLDAVVT